MLKNKGYSLAFLIAALALTSCAHKSGNHDRHKGRHREQTEFAEQSTRSERKIGSHTIVRMKKENGVYLVPIVVNGLNLDFIFDTGAASISISEAEASVMIRQGKITEEDIVGEAQFSDANGDVSEGTVIILRSVRIGDITLENVEASVVHNMQAPLLLGQTALAKFGKVTIDYDNNIIEFN